MRQHARWSGPDGRPELEGEEGFVNILNKQTIEGTEVNEHSTKRNAKSPKVDCVRHT